MQAETTAVDAIEIEALYEFVMALRNGDFSKRLDVPEIGRAREVAMNLNRHMENMELLLREVTRVSTEIAEGKLGPQAEVVANGPWRKMADAVNVCAGNVTSYARDLIWTVNALSKEGRFRRVQEGTSGEWKELFDGMNVLVEKAKADAAKAKA